MTQTSTVTQSAPPSQPEESSLPAETALVLEQFVRRLGGLDRAREALEALDELNQAA